MSLASDLTRRLGGEWRGRYGAVPTPGHGKRDRGTTIHDRADGGVIINSFNADWRDVRDAYGLAQNEVRPMTRRERTAFAVEMRRIKRDREAAQIKRAAGIVEAGCAPAPDGVVQAYLAARGLSPSIAARAVANGALRESRDTSGRPVMLALAHESSGEFRACQMTKLRPDGSGKRGDPARLTFGPFLGSACRLFKFAGDTLGVAEGVETAMAFAQLRNLPVWATFGTANLAAFEPPQGVRRLIIVGDGDAAGLEAGQKLFDRMRHNVRCVLAAAPDGFDWLDVLNRGGAPCR
jgi:hypothetical protein